MHADAFQPDTSQPDAPEDVNSVSDAGTDGAEAAAVDASDSGAMEAEAIEAAIIDATQEDVAPIKRRVTTRPMTRRVTLSRIKRGAGTTGARRRLRLVGRCYGR